MDANTMKGLCTAVLLSAATLVSGTAFADDGSKSPLTVGGAIRFNYVYKSWQTEYPHGFFALDSARLDLNYDDGQIIGSAQYRYYNYPKGQGDYTLDFLHHGWVGMRLADKSTVHVGLDKIPFGLSPYASNNFYESIAYYTGFEDTYDLGVTYSSRPGPFEWQLGFYPRDGGSYRGSANTASGSSRYSFNLARDDKAQGYGTGQDDKERNTLVARMAWHVGTDARQEVGVSGLTGAIRNDAGADSRRNAFAVHYKGTFGPLGVMLEALRYDYQTKHSAAQTYGGLDPNSFVMLGAFGYPYPLASKGDIYIANVSHDIAGTLGPFTGFKLYNDYSILRKRVGNYKDSQQNVTGLSFSAGKWYCYADFMLGKHQPYMSADFGGLASTSATHDGFTRRVNLQAGYYF